MLGQPLHITRDLGSITAYVSGTMTGGRFITFEGGDGVGKSTQLQRLAERLEGAGIGVTTTREPGGTPFAERLRDLILDPSTPDHPPLAEAFLFAAARHDHVECLIRPALERGDWVLSDRFADSTRAYQGAAGGVEAGALAQIEALAHPDMRPGLTIILDLAPDAGRRRIAHRDGGTPQSGDRFERRRDEFQARLREAFLEIAAAEPDRCHVIDAALPEDAVADAIWAAVADRFALKRQ